MARIGQIVAPGYRSAMPEGSARSSRGRQVAASIRNEQSCAPPLRGPRGSSRMENSEIPVRIAGTGDYVPSRRVASAEFDEKWGKPAGWTEERTGIRCRFFASAEETSSFMGAEAARAALSAAGVSARDLDCVVFTACVSEQAIPCTAVLIHRRLGLD